MIVGAEDRSREASFTIDPIAMATTESSTTQHVPAWKRLGLKLKNGQAEAGESGSPVPQKAASDVKHTKRKAAEITGDAQTSHDKSRSRSEGTDGSRSKRRKSVAFADSTKVEDGDSNEKLLEDYVAKQNGGKDQFSKSEVARFTQPPKVHPANEPTIRVNGLASKEGKKDRKKNERAQKEVSEKQKGPRLDLSYVLYLKEYHHARAAWRFRKNQETKVIHNLFNTFRIPESVNEALSSYLAGLQGESARKRIVESAQKIIDDTNDLEGAESIMPGNTDIKAAREKALKKQLKQTKGIIRNQEAAEQAYSDDHQEKLHKRKRAVLVLNSLTPAPGSAYANDKAAVQVSGGDDGVAQPAKKRKTRRHKKMRTGVPGDDDTDETSSVSSVPGSESSSEDEESSSEESDAGSSGTESGSEKRSNSGSQSASDDE